MKRIESAILLVAAALCVQGQQISSGTFSNDKYAVRYATVVEPPRPNGQRLSLRSGSITGSHGNHRYLADEQQKKYFGYDVDIEPLANAMFQVTFKPLNVTREDMHLPGDPASWTLLPIASYPAPATVTEGDTIALELLVNPGTGEKIVEYFTVSAGWKSKSTMIAGAPRDFGLEDVRMSLTGPRVAVNGKTVDSAHWEAHGLAGSVIWIYLPGRGRFLMSIARHDALGFRSAGEVRGSTMKFTWNNDSYEIEGHDQIVPGNGVWNLYVYQDGGYKPAGNPPFLWGAADRAESLIGK
jgi:hypothetical protein